MKIHCPFCLTVIIAEKDDTEVVMPVVVESWTRCNCGASISVREQDTAHPVVSASAAWKK